MAPSSDHAPAAPQLTPDKELSNRINQIDGILPQPAEDPDSDYVIIEESEVKSHEPPLDQLTIYDGLLYEERAASTKPIAELQSRLPSGKKSSKAPEPTLSSLPTAEEYERPRSLQQISRQLDIDIHPLVAEEMRKLAENSGIDWAAKDMEILSRPRTSVEVSGIDNKHEGKLQPV
jgi:hypothetical protein